MNLHSIFLLPFLLIGCGDSEHKVCITEPEQNVSSVDPEWRTREFDRRTMVQSLIKQLADNTQEKRQTAFVELRDKYIRRRDIAELNEKLDRLPESDTKSLMWDLLFLVEFESKWRFPNNVRKNNLSECARFWDEEIKDTGYEARVGYGPDDGLRLTIPYTSEYRTEVINLILDMEPKILTIEGGERESISNNEFLTALVDLMDDITIFGVKDGKHTEISAPKETEQNAEQDAPSNR